VSAPPDKLCKRCARPFSWRKKWAASWEQVEYCSDACRRAKVRDQDRALETLILELLDKRKPGATICPSEAARAASDEWRELMQATRYAANRLAARGLVVVTQKGAVVDAPSARGPIRIRRR